VRRHRSVRLIRALPFVVAVLVTLQTTAARASDLGVVALDSGSSPASDSRWPEAEQRTIAELATVGLAVVRVDANRFEPNDPFASLAAAARAEKAVAGLRLARRLDPPGADIWLVDEVTGKASLRHVSTKDLAPSEAVALVALSVVELLNASLLELRAGHSTHGTRAPPPAVLKMVDRTLEAPFGPYRFAIRGGASVLGSPGGLDLMAGPTIAMGWGFVELFAFEADFTATAVGSTLEGAPGVARVRLGVGRLALVMRSAVSQRVELQVGAGGGAVVAWTDGEASDRYTAHRDTTTVALASAFSAVAARLGRSLRIRLSFGAGLAIPEISVELAGGPAATAGRPLIDAAVGLEWISSWERSTR
jgi:hypothetical protein